MMKGKTSIHRFLLAVFASLTLATSCGVAHHHRPCFNDRPPGTEGSCHKPHHPNSQMA